MIVEDFDIVSFVVLPAKTNSPLGIDSNAVLTLAIALKLFQPVAWNRRQVLKRGRGIQQKQFSQRRAAKSDWQLDSTLPSKNLLCLLIREAPNH
jgi:hypothetical protein